MTSLNPILDAKTLKRRLVNCLPAATFELETFCRLAGIEVTDKIPTAAVECVYRPRLLINPEFVEKYCTRDEHLFLLVMHELWHIILAHTRMYSRATPAHNIAFDAIINATLSRMFPEPEYRGFFEKINPDEKFPQVLLRPPKGWPHNPQYPPNDIEPAGTAQLVKRLYPPANNKKVQTPFYEEILALLRQYAKDNGLSWEGEVILIGNHDDVEGEAQALDNPLLKDIMKKVVKRWPKGNMPGGRQGGKGGEEQIIQTDIEQAADHTKRQFAHTLRRCLNPRAGTLTRKAKREIRGVTGTGVIPNGRDRTAPAKRNLGAPTTLWSQESIIRARVPDVPGLAYIYLDVSGSMKDILPHLIGLLIPYVRKGLAEVFQFSTIIRPLPVAELKSGKVRTSGGTNINCVLEHALNAQSKVRKTMILTDGYTGVPNVQSAERIKESNIRIHVVLPAEDSTPDQLQEISTTLTTLPSIYPGSGW